MQLSNFDDAIEDSQKFSKRHLLLGNGFSIACRANIFHYGSLYDQADFSNIPEVESVFEALQTQDFEKTIRALENAAVILPAYFADGSLGSAKMLEHAATLKEVLVETIAGNHPDLPSSIDDSEFLACRRFLSNFLSGNNNGHVFTLNYDLLLYWAIMHDEDPLVDEAIYLQRNDSFGNDEDEPEADYVVWQGETAAHSANIHYLHGALHLFDAGAELQKYTWVRSGVPLVEQTRKALATNKFPLFVAEGSTVQKKNRIRHNAYLYQGLKVLTSNANQGQHCFFIFGHSLAQNDDHILKRLGKGTFKKLYIGIFGDLNSIGNQEIVARAHAIASMRSEHKPLELDFFDAASANVWGAN